MAEKLQKAKTRNVAAATFNWQQKGWPEFTCDHAALCDELRAFEAAFVRVKAALRKSQSPDAEVGALVDEAVTTSAIEGVRVNESAVMSSICKALGVTCAPLGFARDACAEGVAQMMLKVRADWKKRISANLIQSWHAALMANDSHGVHAGVFRSHADPMRVVRRDSYGEVEVRFEAPPSERVPTEIAEFVEMWKSPAKEAETVALKAALSHLHFESVHPFEDGNGRVGRALVSKALAEGLGKPLVLPVSLVIDRRRKDYYEALHEASLSLDWTAWAKFFVPVLTEALSDFLSAAAFVSAKRTFLSKHEAKLSERAKKVFQLMFRGGLSGVSSGLSASKWMRMTKVSKPTATRDLAELVQAGVLLPEGVAGQMRYRLDFGCSESMDEPINDPINDPIKQAVFGLVRASPGLNRGQVAARLGKSEATAKRALAALVAAGKVEHRGSNKTGGYYLTNAAKSRIC